MSNAEVARITEKVRPLSQWIRTLQPEIARALPRHLDADRVTRLALTIVRQSVRDAKEGQSLADCSPESFAGSLLTASALGLEPGVNQEAYLVPYKRECTLIVGYQGYAKLFWQHPLAKHLDAHAVHANDEFDYGYGLAQYLKHKPAKGDRGPVQFYWAAAELSTGASAFVVLSAEEVKELRGGKVGPSGQIRDPMRWMERKTALRQLIKLLPKSTNLIAAAAVDEQRGSTLIERDIPKAIAEGEGFAQLPPSLAEESQARAEADHAGRVTSAEILNGVNTGTGKVVDPDGQDWAALNAEAAADPQNAGN